MATTISTSQIVAQVAERTGVTKTQAKHAVTAMLEVVGEQLAAGGRIQLSSFGTLEVRERAARDGINPRTREKTRIAASRSVGFRASATLKDRVSRT